MTGSDSRYDDGMRVRREVLGDAHVDRSLARQTDLDADFQRFMDFSTKTGILPEKVDVSKFLARF